MEWQHSSWWHRGFAVEVLHGSGVLLQEFYVIEVEKMWFKQFNFAICQPHHARFRTTST
jgi:hypothetical protein